MNLIVLFIPALIVADHVITYLCNRASFNASTSPSNIFIITAYDIHPFSDLPYIFFFAAVFIE